MQPYVPSRTNKSSGKGVASPASWGGSKRDTACLVKLPVSLGYHFPEQGRFADALSWGFPNLNRRFRK